MIGEFQSYSEYKDSGLDWLGEIPSHWDIVPSKSLFGHRKEKARAEDQMLTASQVHGIIARDEFMAIEQRRVMHVFTGADILKHVEPDDFVMSMRSFQGGLEWSKVRGAISSAYVMLIPKEQVYPPYYAHLLKSKAYISALRRTSDLVRDGQALRYSNFGQVPLPRVPKIEQAAIVRFLDQTNQKIDRFIRAKQKLIALLGEQKQAVIYSAVTRGLNSKAPLKDSGLDWLGEIPSHWDVVPSKSLFGHRKEKARAEDQMLTASQVHGIIARDEFMAIEQRRVMHVFTGADILKHVEPDDFVMSMRSFQGGLEWSKVRGAISSAYVMLIPKEQVYPPYYAHLLKSKAYISALRRTSDLVRDGQALRYSNFGQVPLPRVPIDEQHAIAAYLDNAVADSDAAINRTEREIALLQEYRTRLTADVVSGKLDVRAAGTKRPTDPAEAAADLAIREPLEEIEA